MASSALITASSIKKLTTGQCYRKDLTATALARWTALHRLSKVQAGLAKKAKTKAPTTPRLNHQAQSLKRDQSSVSQDDRTTFIIMTDGTTPCPFNLSQ
jgi:hypothetical protein